MATSDEIFVLDTSVAVGWFFADEPTREHSIAVRQQVGARAERFLIPPLFHAELVHVLARKSRRNPRAVRRALELILRLGLKTQLLSEAALLQTAEWACRGLSGYDATFVALAEDVGGRWLTADGRAARIAGKSAVTLSAWARARNTRSRCGV